MHAASYHSPVDSGHILDLFKRVAGLLISKCFLCWSHFACLLGFGAHFMWKSTRWDQIKNLALGPYNLSLAADVDLRSTAITQIIFFYKSCNQILMMRSHWGQTHSHVGAHSINTALGNHTFHPISPFSCSWANTLMQSHGNFSQTYQFENKHLNEYIPQKIVGRLSSTFKAIVSTQLIYLRQLSHWFWPDNQE